VSNFRAHHLKNFPEEAFSVIVSNQVPYSILWRCYDFDGTTDFCKEKGISYLAYSPLGEGILTGRFNKGTEIKEGIRKNNVLFTEPIFSKALQVVEELKKIAEEKGMSLTQLSIRWATEKEILSSAIVGARKSHHFAENVKSFEFKLEKEIMDKIDRISEEFQKENLVPSLELWVPNCLKEDLEKIGIKV
ncbi:aldo/keto reductase, partial [bacterium]|nr:aldo/keto reductase [bacterium]